MTRKLARIALLLFTLCGLPFAVSAQDERAADRAAIKAHIESIFQAFINKDNAALKATHAKDWFGYLAPSGPMLKGIDAYMDCNNQDPKSPYGMKSYKFREFDMIFKGDAAFVCFVSDVDSNIPSGPYHRVLRICDFYTKDDGKWIQSGSYTAPSQETVESQFASPRSLDEQMRKRLLEAREMVWRAFFAGDRAALEKALPAETRAIEAGDDTWSNREQVLANSTDFAKGGGKLIKLEFPKTEIQMYGSTAVLYSTYAYELEVGGKYVNRSGRVTEVFVLRDGQWLNPGWHMDSGK